MVGDSTWFLMDVMGHLYSVVCQQVFIIKIIVTKRPKKRKNVQKTMTMKTMIIKMMNSYVV